MQQRHTTLHGLGGEQRACLEMLSYVEQAEVQSPYKLQHDDWIILKYQL